MDSIDFVSIESVPFDLSVLKFLVIYLRKKVPKVSLINAFTRVNGDYCLIVAGVDAKRSNSAYCELEAHE